MLAECGNEDDAVKIWEGMKYGPAIANLGYLAWKAGDTGKADGLGHLGPVPLTPPA